MLESVDLNPRRLDVLHRFYKLISAIVEAKGDAYLDVLEIVSYHTGRARRAAISLLMTVWPKAIGHLVVSKPLPTTTYTHSLDPRRQQHSTVDHPNNHQFVPWRFDSTSPTMFERASQLECQACSTSIRGFGLLCPFCMCAVHFDCYDYSEGSHVFEYALASDARIRRMAMHRFCRILPSSRYRRESGNLTIRKGRHNFRLINLFTLTLCFICRRPLWGCTMQGLRCTACIHVAHSSCLLNASTGDLPQCDVSSVDSGHVTIDWTIFRRSFADHFGEFFPPQNTPDNRTYEEISVYWKVLWVQLQLLNNGLALGSIVIRQEDSRFTDPKDNKVDEFELQYLVNRYEERLTSGDLLLSASMESYLQENHTYAPKHALLFDWSAMAYITATIKSTFDSGLPTAGASPSLLNVNNPTSDLDESPEMLSQPFEAVSIAHMRDALGYEFGLTSDIAARHMLVHLHEIGFFERQDLNPRLFDSGQGPQGIYCRFPLPLGLDISNDTETLVGSVEACLIDIDLSVNETGFLLLNRRLWPNGMASEYALRRLTRAILRWIFAEVGDFLPRHMQGKIQRFQRMIAWQRCYGTILLSNICFLVSAQATIRMFGLPRETCGPMRPAQPITEGTTLHPGGCYLQSMALGGY